MNKFYKLRSTHHTRYSPISTIIIIIILLLLLLLIDTRFKITMLFASVCTAVLAAASFAVATPVQSEGGLLTTLNTRQQVQTATCVQGLIYPYSKAELDSLRDWFLTTPDANDTIGPNGWFTWTLGTTRVSARTLGTISGYD